VGLDEPATWSTPGTLVGSPSGSGRTRAIDACEDPATPTRQTTARDAGGETRSSAAPIVNAARATADAAAMPTDGAIVRSKLDAAVLHAQAKQALVGLGWKPAIAQSAVAATLAALGPAAPLEQLIFEALRRCPRPTA
jgi:hypothetical protein